MKQILSILCVVFYSLSANAQSFELLHSDSKLNNGDTIHVQIHPNNFDQQYIKVTNITAITKNILVKKYDLLKIGDAIFSFCWADCYPPETNLSPIAVPINAGDTCENFSAEFESSEQGTSYVLYTFFNESDISDSVSFFIEYKCYTNTIISIAKEQTLSAFPNPAKNNVTIRYSLPNYDNAYLRIYSITGEVMYQETLIDGSKNISLDISNWATGIYMYAIFVNNRNYLSKKLIITK